MSIAFSGFKFVLAAAATAALVACGGGGTSTPAPAAKVATSDATVSIGPANGAAITNAIANTSFTFAGGALGSTTSTVLEFTDKSATPSFKATSSAGVVTGTTTFGSCIFTVKTSTNAAVPVGTVFTETPCTFTVATAGAPANGSTAARTATLTLKLAAGTSSFPVTIAADGAILINGVFLSGVGLSVTTGAN